MGRQPAATRQTGIVKRIVRDRGFGFIASDGGGEELFFHRSALAHGDFERLIEGQRVAFEVGEGTKGPRAENVTLDETNGGR